MSESVPEFTAEAVFDHMANLIETFIGPIELAACMWEGEAARCEKCHHLQVPDRCNKPAIAVRCSLGHSGELYCREHMEPNKDYLLNPWEPAEEPS